MFSFSVMQSTFCCFRICWSPSLLRSGLNELRKLLLQSGYPAGIINCNINDVLSKQQNRTENPINTVPQKDIILVLPYLGSQSKIFAKQLTACINRLYGCFQSPHSIKSFFPYKHRINRSQMSKVVYKASWWNCQDFYIGKTKRRLHDRKTVHFEAIRRVTVMRLLSQTTSRKLVTT